MTCIVGIAHNGKVTIGGDSAGTNNWSQQTIRRDPKVFPLGEFIFGCTEFVSIDPGIALLFRITSPPFT